MNKKKFWKKHNFSREYVSVGNWRKYLASRVPCVQGDWGASNQGSPLDNSSEMEGSKNYPLVTGYIDLTHMT